jgi:hypothetical protein
MLLMGPRGDVDAGVVQIEVGRVQGVALPAEQTDMDVGVQRTHLSSDWRLQAVGRVGVDGVEGCQRSVLVVVVGGRTLKQASVPLSRWVFATKV